MLDFKVILNGQIDLTPNNVSLTKCLNSRKKRYDWSRVTSHIVAAALTLGVVDLTLYNWVKVSAEQMEISRLRAEFARVKMERNIRGKATAYFAKGSVWSTPVTPYTPMWTVIAALESTKMLKMLINYRFI
jgi:transposase